MCTGLELMAAAAIGSTGYTIYNGEKARREQSRANSNARKAAATTAQQAEEANNRANSRTPDTAAALAANQLGSLSGQGSTMLTGPKGVDPNSLTLGRNTLLGG